MDLNTSLTYVKGVGHARGEMLQAKGLSTVEDLLLYLPYRYEDRRNIKPVSQLAPGEVASVVAEIQTARVSSFKRKNLGMFEATLSDGSGATLGAKWFNRAYLANTLIPGSRLSLFGKIELDSWTGRLFVTNPEFETLGVEDESEASIHTARIVPIYEAASKVTTRIFRSVVRHVLGALPDMEDMLPEYLRQRLKLPGRLEAFRGVHLPAENEDVRLLNAFRTQGQIRMIFEEFFWLETGIALKRRKARGVTGIAFELNDKVRGKIKAMLPFKPTGAQKKVLAEIAKDMEAPHPMHRLLQGDVGSGKTIVAAQAAIIAVENGYQVALLAPTEILATQHYLSFTKLFNKIGYVTAPLTGSHTAREKQKLKQLIAQGYVNIAIGTHALLEADVEFSKLGLAIIDEQHRFGVMQRLKLFEKGQRPDVLVMTATPIPRTLALTIYGDLDTSVIDELPPGRKAVVTKQFGEDRIEQVYSQIADQVAKGRQAYVVYPVIEEGETLATKAAEAMFAHLSTTVFPALRVGLLHGKMSAESKEQVMGSFQSGELEILVCTTVIEVGVDVPNATVMVIEQAERFGLAQLHQLRGRVGRGGEQSYCMLVTGKLNDAARERIRTMVESNDGFYIAEMDMKLRGPGEFFGTKQSGLPSLRVANILRDGEILELARHEAMAFVESPPSAEALRLAVTWIQSHWQRRYGLVQVG
ncbi:MAG: ATP-dependent DNA helicase RecG [Bryobacteraceae bacterium]|nr:ATP-dependent DNA helicase RecG [Bryobacteraceae bacterium]